jgi:hypothetical protein
MTGIICVPAMLAFDKPVVVIFFQIVTCQKVRPNMCRVWVLIRFFERRGA